MPVNSKVQAANPYIQRVIDGVAADASKSDFALGFEDAMGGLDCYMPMGAEYRRGYMAGALQVQDPIRKRHVLRQALGASVPTSPGILIKT